MTKLLAALEGRRAGEAWNIPADVRRSAKVKNPGRAPKHRVTASTKVASELAEIKENTTRRK
jgi:hypothetical protein